MMIPESRHPSLRWQRLRAGVRGSRPSPGGGGAAEEPRPRGQRIRSRPRPMRTPSGGRGLPSHPRADPRADPGADPGADVALQAPPRRRRPPSSEGLEPETQEGIPAQVSNGEAGGDSQIRTRTWKRESICRGERFSFPEVEDEVIYDDVPCEGLDVDQDGAGLIYAEVQRGEGTRLGQDLGWSSSEFESYSEGESGEESRPNARAGRQAAGGQRQDLHKLKEKCARTKRELLALRVGGKEMQELKHKSDWKKISLELLGCRSCPAAPGASQDIGIRGFGNSGSKS
ncbi:rho guanine nucleotide exchange factor 10-like protein [Camarhynchus parvulus]|uniref:rho guanine nucleotide exchange factor 10-like protein n=1 Tax=Geospiza parvula TaxID=87175 RepID=UPI001237D51D|nr:rho guanine nucleotide exchange factor 10-like protein [Camarhynchus parvulus]